MGGPTSIPGLSDAEWPVAGRVVGLMDLKKPVPMTKIGKGLILDQ